MENKPQVSDYQLAKQVVIELGLHKEMVVVPANNGNFRKYMRDVQKEKEFVTKKANEGLKITRLK